MELFRLLLLSFFCLFLHQAIAQKSSSTPPYITKKTVKGKAKKAFEKGMEHNFKDQNEAAIKEFEKALKYEPSFINAHLQRAACYYAMANFKEAEKGFEKVIEIDPLYNKKVFYTLALTEMKQEKFEEAARHYIAYIDTNPRNKTLLTKAKKHLNNCNFIVEALKNPVPFAPFSLGDEINTPAWEYLPSLTADENLLVYTFADARRSNEDFFISRKIDGVWQKGQPIKAINTPLNEGAQSISADGKLMIFTACDRKDGYGRCDLYYSEVQNNRWTKPLNMGAQINSKSSDRQPSISANGQTLYFSSNRSGGHGGYDLWASQRKADGSWGKPVNLGPTVNTPDHESTPFIHADGKSLYFMSDGHPGMGKFDLYFTRLKAGEQWETPTNLGYPINTRANDAALVISLDGQTAYFASDRDYQKATEDERPTTDLYSFELYKAARPNAVTYVKAKVIDADSQSPLKAKVEFIDLISGKTHTSSVTDSDGEFLICLPAGTDYALNVSKEGFLFHSENFALKGSNQLNQPFLLEIALQAIPELVADNGTPLPEKSKPIILKNVFFDTGSAKLSPSSYYELDRLQALLQNSPQLVIQINGHTDNVGSEEDNLRLSEQRAKAVFDYLVEKDIEADRLRYKGYGETRPIESNESAESRQENRRTEFEIVR